MAGLLGGPGRCGLRAGRFSFRRSAGSSGMSFLGGFGPSTDGSICSGSSGIAGLRRLPRSARWPVAVFAGDQVAMPCCSTLRFLGRCGIRCRRNQRRHRDHDGQCEKLYCGDDAPAANLSSWIYLDCHCHLLALVRRVMFWGGESIRPFYRAVRPQRARRHVSDVRSYLRSGLLQFVLIVPVFLLAAGIRLL